MATKKHTPKITARERRKAAQLDAEIKAWALALRRSQRSIRASIAAGMLAFRRGRLRWIGNKHK